jgi:hypothetical protein
MIQASLPPLFFSSIPKCGKNLIYSFFFALGYKRFRFEDDSYNHYSNLLPFNDLQGRDHYVTERSTHHGIDCERVTLDFRAAICAIPDGYIGHRHMHPDGELLNALRVARIKPIFIYRDPRDCLVSAVHYAFNGKPEHISKMLGGLSEEDALLALLSGRDSLIPFARWYDAYRSWLDVPDSIPLRFEDIIGGRGGGTDARQKECFENLVSGLGIQVTREVFDTALSKAFNPRAGTFRSGQIGGWRKSFSKNVVQEFELKAGHLLNLWGFKR